MLSEELICRPIYLSTTSANAQIGHVDFRHLISFYFALLQLKKTAADQDAESVSYQEKATECIRSWK